jgi:hypothetical protein
VDRLVDAVWTNNTAVIRPYRPLCTRATAASLGLCRSYK